MHVWEIPRARVEHIWRVQNSILIFIKFDYPLFDLSRCFTIAHTLDRCKGKKKTLKFSVIYN